MRFSDLASVLYFVKSTASVRAAVWRLALAVSCLNAGTASDVMMPIMAMPIINSISVKPLFCITIANIHQQWRLTPQVQVAIGAGWIKSPVLAYFFSRRIETEVNIVKRNFALLCEEVHPDEMISITDDNLARIGSLRSPFNYLKTAKSLLTRSKSLC
jgi:hypothetical protein